MSISEAGDLFDQSINFCMKLHFASAAPVRETSGEFKSNATTSDNKRADLQGLRGVAILFVLVMHLWPSSYRLGFVGVDIFFVLSGFLMAKILLEKKFTTWSVWRFYTRRFKRIVPLYMLLAVAVYVYGYFYILRPDRKQILDDLAWVYTYSSNLQPIFEKLGYWDQLSTYRFFVHTWSLGVELQYYLIVPVIMGLAFCCEHHVRLILFLSLGIFSIIFQLYAPPKISYGFLLSRIWQFMSGSIAYEFSKTTLSSTDYEPLLNRNEEGTLEADNNSYADMGSSMNRRASNKRFLCRVSSLLANAFLLVLVLLVAVSPKSVSDSTARICSTLMAGVVVYLNADVFCLTNVMITYCGDISYVLYLVHWPIIVTARYVTDSQILNAKGVATVLLAAFTLSVVTHHTFEKFFMKRGVIVAFMCVVACYVCILGTKSMYLYAPPLESINPNTSKIEYAIEWNMRESHKVYYAMPCSRDVDTERYTKFRKEHQLRCVAKGNGTANIILIGNSIAYRAYPLFHDILKGRYRNFRLYSRSSCPPLSNLCPDFTEAMKKVVQHENPDILWYMHFALYPSFVAPFRNLSKDRIYKEFQGNIDFISNYTKHIVIDMPYYRTPFNAGVKLAKRLQYGLPPGDEFVVTRQQLIEQTQYHRLRLSSLNCSKCIMNEINDALFKDGLFYVYDPKTFLVRLGDGLHMTPDANNMKIELGFKHDVIFPHSYHYRAFQ
ncbi:unnamed protein product [Cylicocyclus nassatus]|uniref:Acyl_transf_3 domain-containing protein n=1 Tax=Cylicocyclus nassatus TaxID=53992 RepID=A0AA36H8A8_CYLNA|nr:unnamed protein product [Cylicocyclus nassatus]